MATVYLIYLWTCVFFLSVIVRSSPLVEHERRHEEDIIWSRGDRVHGRTVVPVRVGLTQSNLDKGYDLLMEVSHPSSEKYGQHYTVDQIIEVFAPSIEAVQLVRLWLEREGGITNSRVSLSTNKQWRQFDARVTELEHLLNTTYHHYHHHESDATSLGCDRYHIPASIQGRIDYIVPGVKLLQAPKTPSPKTQLERRNTSPSSKLPAERKTANVERYASRHNCHLLVTPRCVRELYNVSDSITLQPGNTLGIYENHLSFLNPQDLSKFFSKFANFIPNDTYPKVNLVDGAPNPKSGGGGIEAALDFQVAYPLVYPDKIELFQVDDLHWENKSDYYYKHHNGLYNNFLDAIDGSYCNFSAFGITGNSPDIDPYYPDPAKDGYKGQLQCGKFRPPNVISFSWDNSEAHYPVNYLRRQCAEFMKLGMQGITVLMAIGDRGVAPGESLSPQHLGCLGKDGKKFGITSGASCPFVTAVGGTLLPHGHKPGQEPEAGASISGGGFSNVFPIPSYQGDSLKTYFKNHNPPYPYYETKYSRIPPANAGNARYNRAGRGVPDIAANAGYLGIVFNGRVETVGGTSESAPLTAGLFTRINNARLAAGKTPVGFVNPVLVRDKI